MDFDEIVKGIISKYNFAEVNFTQTWEELSIDSCDSVGVILDCEQEFNIEIPDNEIADIMRFDAPAQGLLDYLKLKIETANQGF